MNGIHTLARGSVLIGLVVLGLKYFAYYPDGQCCPSSSDAIESIVNVAKLRWVALLAIRLEFKNPLDDEHPTDITRPEYFFKAVNRGRADHRRGHFSIFSRGVFRPFLAPRRSGSGLGRPCGELPVAGFHQTPGGSVAFDPSRAAAEIHLLSSPMGRHLFTDVAFLRFGVLGGVGNCGCFGWAVLDPALAAAVCLEYFCGPAGVS